MALTAPQRITLANVFSTSDLQGAVALVNGDIRIVPCMTNTTVDTERDAMDAVSDFATLASKYGRTPVAPGGCRHFDESVMRFESSSLKFRGLATVIAKILRRKKQRSKPML